jgi:hypothetical protein
MATTRSPRAEHLQPVFRRAAYTKVLLAGAGALAFLGAAGLAKRSYASHPKGHPRALAAPPQFERSVQRDLLQGGRLAPPQAPPEAATSAS